jgi:hypothetical protein
MDDQSSLILTFSHFLLAADGYRFPGDVLHQEDEPDSYDGEQA